jgi:hypothetical protein
MRRAAKHMAVPIQSLFKQTAPFIKATPCAQLLDKPM